MSSSLQLIVSLLGLLDLLSLLVTLDLLLGGGGGSLLGALLLGGDGGLVLAVLGDELDEVLDSSRARVVNGGILGASGGRADGREALISSGTSLAVASTLAMTTLSLNSEAA